MPSAPAVLAVLGSSSIGLRGLVRWLVWGIVAPMLALAPGCSGDSGRPKTAPVSGRIMYQGKPVEGALVSFFADGSSRAAGGKTDSDGRFKLTTFDTNDGAPVGEHAVTITKPKKSAGSAPEINLDNPGEAYTKQMAEAASGKPPETDLPPKYADSKESGLRRTVTEKGPNEFVFELD